jgi:hypothetical protein
VYQRLLRLKARRVNRRWSLRYLQRRLYRQPPHPLTPAAMFRRAMEDRKTWPQEAQDEFNRQQQKMESELLHKMLYG